MAIGRILDAPRSPTVSISPDKAWMLELDRPSLPPIAELAEEELPPVAQTMRQLHVAPDARANRVSASGTLGMPLGAAKVTPIGLNVKRQIDARGAGALGRKAEFSKHYDADAFVL